MLKKVLFGAVMLAALLPAQSQAQEQPSTELVLYPKGHFKGGGYPIAGASQSMRVFTVKSVKVPEGQSWELCSGNTFTGCKEFSKSDEAMVFNVRSVRPVAPKITAVAAEVGAVVTGPNPSLRGMKSLRSTSARKRSPARWSRAANARDRLPKRSAMQTWSSPCFQRRSTSSASIATRFSARHRRRRF